MGKPFCMGICFTKNELTGLNSKWNSMVRSSMHMMHGLTDRWPPPFILWEFKSAGWVGLQSYRLCKQPILPAIC